LLDRALLGHNSIKNVPLILKYILKLPVPKYNKEGTRCYEDKAPSIHHLAPRKRSVQDYPLRKQPTVTIEWVLQPVWTW
jgi:hypothetical protein